MIFRWFGGVRFFCFLFASSSSSSGCVLVFRLPMSFLSIFGCIIHGSWGFFAGNCFLFLLCVNLVTIFFKCKVVWRISFFRNVCKTILDCALLVRRKQTVGQAKNESESSRSVIERSKIDISSYTYKNIYLFNVKWVSLATHWVNCVQEHSVQCTHINVFQACASLGKQNIETKLQRTATTTTAAAAVLKR